MQEQLQLKNSPRSATLDWQDYVPIDDGPISIPETTLVKLSDQILLYQQIAANRNILPRSPKALLGASSENWVVWKGNSLVSALRDLESKEVANLEQSVAAPKLTEAEPHVRLSKAVEVGSVLAAVITAILLVGTLGSTTVFIHPLIGLILLLCSGCFWIMSKMR